MFQDNGIHFYYSKWLLWKKYVVCFKEKHKHNIGFPTLQLLTSVVYMYHKSIIV